MRHLSMYKPATLMRRGSLQGAPEIQAFCLGHTAFASCTAFTSGPGGLRLLSGSGDGTVRRVLVFRTTLALQSPTSNSKDR